MVHADELFLRLDTLQVLDERVISQFIFAEWRIVSEDKEAFGRKGEAILRHDVQAVAAEERVQTEHLMSFNVILNEFFRSPRVRDQVS